MPDIHSILIAIEYACSMIRPDHARHLVIIVIDYVWSIIRSDHANHQIYVPVESNIPNHGFVNFVMVL